MADAIYLEDVIIPAKVGVYEYEKDREQPVRFQVRLEFDARQAGRSDSIRDTINYVEAYERIQRIGGSKHFNLLEHLCEEIAASLLELDIQKVRIRAEKVNNPVFGMLGRISVEIERAKG